MVDSRAIAAGIPVLQGGEDVKAVNHSGDSDSLGAVAGNLLRALHGASSIPTPLSQPVEMRDLIAIVARDLYDIGHDPDEGLRPALQERWLADAHSVLETPLQGRLQPA